MAKHHNVPVQTLLEERKKEKEEEENKQKIEIPPAQGIH